MTDKNETMDVTVPLLIQIEAESVSDVRESSHTVKVSIMSAGPRAAPCYGSLTSSSGLGADNDECFCQQEVSLVKDENVHGTSLNDQERPYQHLLERTDINSQSTPDKPCQHLLERTDINSQSTPDKPFINDGLPGNKNLTHDLEISKLTEGQGRKIPASLTRAEMTPLSHVSSKNSTQEISDTSGSNDKHNCGRSKCLSVEEGVSNASPAPTFGETVVMLAFTSLWQGPLVAVFWFSTWNILDIVISPDNYCLNLWTCAIIGFPGYIIICILQGHITSAVKATGNSYVALFLSRVHTYVMAIFCVCQWRTVWELEDYYLGVSESNAIPITIVSLVLMVLLRCLKSANSPPSNNSCDFPLEGYFTVTTYFNTKPGTLKHVLDSAVSSIVVTILVVSFWRSLWTWEGFLIYPESMAASALVSMIASYTLLTILSLCQNKACELSARLESTHWMLMLAFEDMFVLLQTIASLNHWRGFWLLLDVYDVYRPTSLWLLHAACYILLTLTLASKNLAVFVFRDGVPSNGEGLRLDTFYLTVFRRPFSLTTQTQLHGSTTKNSVDL